MKQKTVQIKFGKTSSNYQIKIGHGFLDNCGGWARESLSTSARKIVLVSNAKVFRLYGKQVKESLEKANFEVFVWLMKDGEKHKNLRSLENALKFFSEKKLSRTDSIVALSGGVAGDLAGFAAAIYLRGVSFLQIPTTLLAMIDSSVGGKTGINSGFGKNLIGAFHQPRGVLIDVETLKTLPSRELTAGFCEAVKQSAIGGEDLFAQISRFLEKYQPNRFKNYFASDDFLSEIENLIEAQVKFKAQIVAGDEQESVERIDAKSRKILNFGHTVAHALEKITNYKRFKHGEAVGYGILCAGEIAKNIGIFEKNKLKSLNDVVGRVGKLPPVQNIDIQRLIEAFEFDKKSTNKALQWILLKEIGEPVIVSSEKIPTKILLKSLNKVLKNK
jgi:3-dehydroquinate synthase